MSIQSRTLRAAVALCVVARVVVGVLWIEEAVTKFRAGFGSADILLVADSAMTNSRVPDWFAPVEMVMRFAPTAMGVAISLLELTLGVLLLVGCVTRWVAVASIATLMLYWASDQLIAQYPAMVLLSVCALAIPAGTSRVWRVLTRALRGLIRARRTAPAAPQE